MFIEKIINKKRGVIFIGIGIIILLGVIGGSYYWWTGTPGYSISQIKKAVETHNPELGLKYVDTDAIFENLWTDMKSKIMSQTSGAGGFEAIGTMIGLQLVESMKPALKEQVKQGAESWFSASTAEKTKETTGIKENLELGGIWQQKDLKIKKQGNSAYIELPDNVKIIFTKKEGARYWVISKIEGFAENLPTEETQQKESQITIEKNIGDEIELTTLKFKVNKAEEKQTISSSYGTPKVAKENTKFIVINLDLTNITDTPFVFTNLPGFTLIDNKGRQYAEYDGVIGGIDNYLEQRKLSPDIKENGFFVYEVPTDAVNYSLNIGKTGTNEIYKVILK